MTPERKNESYKNLQSMAEVISNIKKNKQERGYKGRQRKTQGENEGKGGWLERAGVAMWADTGKNLRDLN